MVFYQGDCECHNTVPESQPESMAPWWVPGQLCAGTHTPRGCVRTIYAGYNSQTLIFPPVWNYSRFFSFSHGCKQPVSERLAQAIFDLCDKEAVQASGNFPARLHFSSPNVKGHVKLRRGSFSRTIICCLFFIYCVTAMQ